MTTNSVNLQLIKRLLTMNQSFMIMRSEGTRLSGKTWKEVVDSDLKCLHLHASDAPDHKKWRKLMRGKQSQSDDKTGDSG